MKNSAFLITVVVGFLSSSLTAQKTVWFDAKWNISTKETAAYYRPIPKQKEDGFWIVDYYISNKKQKEGLSISSEANNEIYEGIVNYFHENGEKFQILNYVEGELKGKFSRFYDSGELEMTGKYSKGLREGIWKTFYKNGKIKTRGKYRKGEKVGIWKTFYKNVY